VSGACLSVFACLDCCLPYYSTTVCLSQLLFACLNYCLSVSTTVCPQLTSMATMIRITFRTAC
jgi:hypothetical protein